MRKGVVVNLQGPGHAIDEALGEAELVLRLKGRETETRRFEPLDSIRAELEAFADAVRGRAPYPITPEEMVTTVATFEAVVQSIARGATSSRQR